MTMFLKLIFIHVLFSLGLGDEAITDCLTHPCVTVPGVGKIKGTTKQTQFTSRDYKAFFGIPFGESTGGEERFRPPQPRAPLNDGKDAFDASYLTHLLSWWDHVCPQPGVAAPEEGGFDNPLLAQFFAEHPEMMNQSTRGLPGAVIGSEDCLHLAVFTPQLPTANVDPELPVMVYIHGGSFMLGGYIGAGAGKLLERDMVIVEMQYRVGPLGFFCLPDDDVAGNMGLLDQALALQWVQNHIAYFGGDPNRVTIMGESAGSASVTYHMLSELSMPLFNQAIGQSGSALSSWAHDNEPEKHAKEISGIIGCDASDNANMISCLKNDKTIQDIVLGHKAYYTIERENARMGFGGSAPCAQSHGATKFISKHPKDILMEGVATGNLQPKKAIFGANQHEGSFVLGMIYNSYLLPNNVMEDTFFLRHYFTETMLEALGLKDDSGVIYELINYRFFSDNQLGDWCAMIDGMINLVGTFFIKASTYEFMKYNDLVGSSSYFYSFEHYGNGSLWNFLFPGDKPPIPRGITHGDELIYLFSTGVFELTEEDWDMAYILTNLWANFVIYGEPVTDQFPIAEVPSWPLWHDSHMSYLKIDTSPEVRTGYLTTWENTPEGPDKVPCL